MIYGRVAQDIWASCPGYMGEFVNLKAQNAQLLPG